MTNPTPKYLPAAVSLLVALAAGCAGFRTVDVPSANQNSRIQHLVFHFTTVPFDESLRLLTERTDRPVSVHYLIPEPGDPTYPRSDPEVYRLVPEQRRAWHAGRSAWGRKQSLNDSSIGIELVNLSTCHSRRPDAEVQTPDMLSCRFAPFPEAQIDLVIRLVQDILERHPEIDPVDIVGHSDIAPDRRSDPGPLFPWRRLYENGIGAWFDDDTVGTYRRRFDRAPPDPALVRRALSAYGYSLDAPDDPELADIRFRFVVRAFQLHFRPERADGVVDAETAARLWALLEKYRPRALDGLTDGA
ncbi:MAG: N-acetylmuramoyl-L-alanine amidase [Acidobacteriota bacterium]